MKKQLFYFALLATPFYAHAAAALETLVQLTQDQKDRLNQLEAATILENQTNLLYYGIERQTKQNLKECNTFNQTIKDFINAVTLDKIPATFEEFKNRHLITLDAMLLNFTEAREQENEISNDYSDLEGDMDTVQDANKTEDEQKKALANINHSREQFVTLNKHTKPLLYFHYQALKIIYNSNLPG